MKIFFKIIGMFFILFLAFVTYFIYQAASSTKTANNIVEASAEFYEQNKSFKDFCDVSELRDAERRGFEVSCRDSANDLDLSFSTESYDYRCKPALTINAEGFEMKRLSCIRTDKFKESADGTNVTIGYNSPLKFDSSLAIKTSQDPQICDIPKFTDLENGLLRFERAIMPGVYTNTISNVYIGEDYEGDRDAYLRERAIMGSLAVKEDGSTCYCNISRNPDEVIASERGKISENGIINWFGNTVIDYPNLNRSPMLLVSLINDNGSYEGRGFSLIESSNDNFGSQSRCRGVTDWKPIDLLNEDEVCECSIL